MKLVRFEYRGRVFQGEVVGEEVITQEYNFPLSQVKILTPSQPSKIVCVGLNYKTHAEELNMEIPDKPVIFLKPPSATLEHLGSIVYPYMSKRVDYEAELCAVIAKKAKNVSRAEAMESILGYTCFNDITARDIQQQDKQWTRAKSFDTFAPFGPFIETDVDVDNLKVELYLNGKLRQTGPTSDMIFSIPEIVSFISEVMTLLPGDIIATGTPPGIGELKVGDEVEVVISDVGRLINYVIGESDSSRRVSMIQ